MIDLMFIGEKPERKDVLLKQMYAGIERKFLEYMICKADSGEFVRYDIVPYCETDDVLCGISSVVSYVKSADAHGVIFIGDDAERFYRKEFAYGKKIQSLRRILEQGGTRSPAFLPSVNTIREVLWQRRKS